MARILWSREALRNLESIGDYLYESAPEYAAALLPALVKATERLETFPRLGRIVPEFEAEAFRELIFENYRIVYAIEADTVIIYSLLHSPMDISGRLRALREKP